MRRPIRLLACRVALLLAVSAAIGAESRGQAQTLVSQDFEGGLGGWTTDGPQSLWHLAATGECGAITAMAACNNGPAACDFAAAPGLHWVRLHSPWFQLTGSPPWTFSFDYLKDTDDAPDVATLWIELGGGDGLFNALAMDLPDTSSLQHREIVVPTFGDFWQGKSVRLEFELQTDFVGNTGFGLLVDNVTVRNVSGWTDLGKAHPGGAGTASLSGTGSLAARSDNRLDLSGAHPSSTAAIVFGPTVLHAPFKGGTLVPTPLLMVFFVTDPAGHARLPFTMPPGIPPFLALFFQAWILDPGASDGVAASNALMGQTS